MAEGYSAKKDHLTINNLRKVRGACWEARTCWMDIGIELGLKKTDLDAIKTNLDNDPKKCFTEMLTLWLKQVNPLPTHRALVEVLRNPIVNLGQLAESVENEDLLVELSSSEVITPRVVVVPYEPDNQLFPHIDDIQDKQSRTELEQRLKAESEEIRLEFGILMNKYFDSLEDRQYSIPKLVRHLKTGLEVDCLLPEPKIIDDIMKLIESKSSFFNYQLIEYMIKLSGTDDDKKNLGNYRTKFSNYAKRRVYECPAIISKSNLSEAVLHVKLDSKYNKYTVDELTDFQSRLCRILNRKVYAIRLLSVQRGCLKLVYAISNYVVNATFPLTEKQESELAALGILQLICNDYRLKSTTSQVQIPGDDSPQMTRSNEELLDMIQQWNLDNSEREIVVIVGGKSETGKSTLISNFLTLDGKEAAEARIQPTSVTHNVKVYKGEVSGIHVRAVDMPGLHARRHSSDIEKEVIAALSHHTEGKADILIYCVSLTQRLDSIDERNIATLNKAFGEKLWTNAILVLTHADTILEDEDNADKLDDVVEEFAKKFEEILADCSGIKACAKPFSFSDPDPSLASEGEESSLEIVAIPTGKKPDKPPGWRDSLLAQVITICQKKSISYVTKLEGVSWEKIKKKLKKGAKVGAIAGAVGGVSGAAVGTGVGVAIGAFIGGILTAPIGGVGAVPTAAGGAALGGFLGSLFGGGGTGVVALLAGGLTTAHNENLFKDIAFYYEVQKKLEELQKKRLSESSD